MKKKMFRFTVFRHTECKNHSKITHSDLLYNNGFVVINGGSGVLSNPRVERLFTSNSTSIIWDRHLARNGEKNSLSLKFKVFFLLTGVELVLELILARLQLGVRLVAEIVDNDFVGELKMALKNLKKFFENFYSTKRC